MRRASDSLLGVLIRRRVPKLASSLAAAPQR